MQFLRVRSAFEHAGMRIAAFVDIVISFIINQFIIDKLRLASAAPVQVALYHFGRQGRYNLN